MGSKNEPDPPRRDAILDREVAEVNALLFQGLGSLSGGIALDPRCQDAERPTLVKVLLHAVVTAVCVSGLLKVINILVKKNVYYQFSEEQKRAKVRSWERKEKFVVLLGVLYIIGTCLYVAAFLFMVPWYAAYGYIQATIASLAIIELMKPLLEAGILTVILKSRYSVSFAAYFPQLSDFSHLHVLQDAEFTHAHWAELSRVLNSEVDEEKGDAEIGSLRTTLSMVTEPDGNLPEKTDDTDDREPHQPLLRADAAESEGLRASSDVPPPSPTSATSDHKAHLEKVIVHMETLDMGHLRSTMKSRGC
jgi:hypothetical protein